MPTSKAGGIKPGFSGLLIAACPQILPENFWREEQILNPIWEPHLSRIQALPIELVMQGFGVSCCKFTANAMVSTQLMFLRKPDIDRVNAHGGSLIKLDSVWVPCGAS